MSKEIIPVERIAHLIFVFRKQKVMLDSDLATLYGVSTGHLNRAVKRNPDRFPHDFMFQLSLEEVRDPSSSPNKASQCSPAFCKASVR
jgi:hypothetical protein